MGVTSAGPFSTYDVGFSLSGPVVKDRLWFFTAYNPNFEDRDVEIPGLGAYRDSRKTHLLTGKLTWQAGPNTNLMLTLLGDPSAQRRIGTTFAGGFPTPAKLLNPDPFLGSLKTGGITLSLKVRHSIREKALLEASLSRADRKQNDVPDTERGRTEPFYADFTTGTWSGDMAGCSRTTASARRRRSAGRCSWGGTR